MGNGAALQQWESFPGAATRPLGCYKRREPESTVLHQVVSEHLESLLRELAMEGRCLPKYEKWQGLTPPIDPPAAECQVAGLDPASHRHSLMSNVIMEPHSAARSGRPSPLRSPDAKRPPSPQLGAP